MKQQRPTITITKCDKTDRYQIDVVGKYGGGFTGCRKSLPELIQFIPYLKSYDCGKEKAFVMCPANLEKMLSAFFPQVVSIDKLVSKEAA